MIRQILTDYHTRIGSKGGKAGSREQKQYAARVSAHKRFGKPLPQKPEYARHD
jgi:hypothetical protein